MVLGTRGLIKSSLLIYSLFSTVGTAIIKINRFPLRHAREYNKLDWKLKIPYLIVTYLLNCSPDAVSNGAREGEILNWETSDSNKKIMIKFYRYWMLLQKVRKVYLFIDAYRGGAVQYCRNIIIATIDIGLEGGFQLVVEYRFRCLGRLSYL